MSREFKYPLSYPLNRANVRKFINASAHDAQAAIRKFIKATIHISFETFIAYINSNLEDIVKDVPPNRPLFAYIKNYTDYEHKSNYWLYMYIKRQAKAKYNMNMHFVNDIDDSRIKYFNDVILLIDDCIYSGMQLAEAVGSLKSSYHKQIRVVLFVSFMSEDGLQTISEAFTSNPFIRNCTLVLPKHTYKIRPLSDYMTRNEFASIIKYYNMHPYMTENELQKYPIYFDHKLADNVSTFPVIYSGLVPNKKNKDILTNGLNEGFEMYPLLSNCEHIKVPEFEESTCPSPPYKAEHLTFIRSLLKKSHTSRRNRSATTRKSMMSNSKSTAKSV